MRELVAGIWEEAKVEMYGSCYTGEEGQMVARGRGRARGEGGWGAAWSDWSFCHELFALNLLLRLRDADYPGLRCRECLCRGRWRGERVFV